MYTLIFVIFVNVLGFGLIIPLLPFFVERLGGGPEIVTLIIAMYALIQFATSPWIGRLSDRFGRRPVLMWTTAGTAFAHVLLGFADSLWLVVLSRAVAGVMAGNLGVAFAYTTDITSGKDRAKAFGRLTTGFTLGFTFGPAIGGLLAGADMATANFARPAFSAAAMSLIACACVFFFLPESMAAKDASAPEPGKSKASFFDQLRMVWEVNVLAKLAIVSFLFFMAWTLHLSIFALWSDRTFQASPAQIGFMFMYMGLIGSLVQFFAIGPTVKRYGEMRVLHVTTVGLLLSFFALTFSTSLLWVACALTVMSAANAVFTPVSTSLVSKQAPARQRGAVLGIFQSIGSLGRVAGPAFSGVAFANLGYDTPYHIGALVMIPCLILLLQASRAFRAKQEKAT